MRLARAHRPTLAARSCALLVWLTHVGVAAQPRAAEPVPLSMPIEVDPCVPVDVPSFQRQLAIELEASPQASDLAHAQTSSRIALGCQHDQISVEVTDAAAHKAWRRKVELRGVDPRAHTRLLALSVAELLLASWLEQRMDAQPLLPAPMLTAEPQPRATPQPQAAPQPRDTPQLQAAPQPRTTLQPSASTAPEPETPPTAAPAGETPSTPAQPAPAPASDFHKQIPLLRLGAAVDALAFTSTFAPIPGGELHVGVPLSAAWALRGAAQAGHGALTGSFVGLAGSSQPRVSITTASLALSLHALTHAGDFELSLGAGVRLGLAHLAGQTSDRLLVPARAFAPWIGPLLAPSASYRISAALRATLSLEAGWMAVRVRALGPEDSLVTELRGPWLLLSLGLDVGLFP